MNASRMYRRTHPFIVRTYSVKAIIYIAIHIPHTHTHIFPHSYILHIITGYGPQHRNVPVHSETGESVLTNFGLRSTL